MRIPSYLLAFASLFLFFINEAHAFSWTQVSSAHGARWEGMSAAVNDKMYVFTGVYTDVNNNGQVNYQPISEVYDPATDQWTILPQMPVLVTHEGVAQVGSSIWFISGFNENLQAVNNVQILNTLDNTWIAGPALPISRGGGAAVYVNNKIHFFGGLMPDRRTASADHYVLDLNNPAAGWIARAPMPDARNHFAAVELNGKIYAIGGQYNHDGPRVEVALVDVYDPVTNTWSDGVNLPSPISHHEPGTFVHEDKIILVSGGFEGTGNQNILQFDPAINQWTIIGQLPISLFSASARVIGNQLIVCNGGNPTRHNTRKETYIATFSGSGNQPPSDCVLEVESFTLMYPGTAGEIGELDEGSVINLSVNNSFNIRANPCSSDVKSVKFFLNGSLVRTESSLPYAIAGDSPVGNYNSWTLAPGNYILTITPHSLTGGEGATGTAKTISFSVINQSENSDCNGTVSGSAFIDDCGICSGGSTGHIANSDKDDCGICFGNNGSKDCNGICNGSAFIDNCGNCAGGNTGLSPCSVDCNGVPGGEAFIDDCGICSGGNTGHVANSDKDDCGVCFGNNANKDCSGVCFGSNTNCCQSNNDCNDNDPCTDDACVNHQCQYLSSGSSEPSYLRVINPAKSWRKLKLGYAENTLWGDVQDVAAGGNHQLCVTMRDAGGDAEWNRIEIRPQGNSIKAAILSNYVPANPGNEWFTICIPLSDFSPFSGFTQLTMIEIPYSNGAEDFEIHIQKIEFTGGGTPFLWFGGTKSDNFHDGNGANGALLAELSEGSPCDLIAVDCNGVENGTASLDDCGICSGGYSGHIANSDKDDCGICFGNNASIDCNGNCNGTAFIDGCGNCAGGNTGNPPCAENAVISLTLVDAVTNQDIKNLANGDVIDLSVLGDKLSVRANTNPIEVGSVVFSYNGNAKYTIENIEPYTIKGDNGGNYHPWTPAMGNNLLIATPYSGRSGTGTAGAAMTVNFHVINSSAKMSAHDHVESISNDSNIDLNIYPNPNNGLFMLHITSSTIADIQIKIFNAIGMEIYALEKATQDDSNSEVIDLSHQPSGIYLVRMQTKDDVLVKKVVVRN